MCSSDLAVREGQVHVQGTPEEVITEETVREVFEVESRIMPDPVAGTPMCIPVGRKGKVSDRA